MRLCGRIYFESEGKLNKCLMHLQIFDSKNSKAQYFHVIVSVSKEVDSRLTTISLDYIELSPYTGVIDVQQLRDVL